VAALLFKDINQNAIVRGGAERNAVNAPIKKRLILPKFDVHNDGDDSK
jgi:hypothetical protein